jgi:chromosome partitioning protein
MTTPIFAIANQKGGVGKTTTAINLSACLVERRQRVLLVDLDPQANATSGLGMPKAEGGSLYRLLLAGGDVRAQIRPTAYRRFDLIPSEVDLAGAEVDIVMARDYLHRLGGLLRPLAETGEYDQIFIDCPPSLGVLTMNAMTAADALLVPMQCEYYALEGVSTILRIVEQIRTTGANPRLQIDGVVLTMYDARTKLAQQVVVEIFQHFGDRVYESLIPRNVRLSEAPSYGKPVVVYDRHSTGAVAYRRLAREFLKRHPRPAADGEASPPGVSEPEGLDGVQPAEAAAPAPAPAGPSEPDAAAPAAEPPAGAAGGAE